jgi:hypothetical protein
MSKWPLIRDIILFFTGLGLIVAEAFRHGTERPTLLLLYAAMVGLPAFLQKDEKQDKGGG